MVEDSSLLERKRAARSRLRRVIAGVKGDVLRRKSTAACAQLCAAAEYRDASVVMMFLSLPHEIDTAEAVLHAIEQGKTVVVPRVLRQSRQMVPVRLERLDCEMVTDRYGLRHPRAAKPVPLAQIDLVVTPGLGFDVQGNRLGRGGGYYDRFLQQDGFKPVVCGLALEEQISEKVPVSCHDVTLDMLITDRAIRRFNHPR